MDRLPRLISIVSGCYILGVVAWFLSTIPAGGFQAETVFDLVLILIPGVTSFYVGLRLPAFEIEPRNYPMLIGWVLAGVGAMALFLLLRELHPGVDADWTVGTRAIAFTIGSVGGLLIGLQQARAITRTQQLERRNEDLAAREWELAHQNRRLDRFTGVVSHDLRSPLASTVGWIEMAKADSDSAYLVEATDGLSRMGTIITNTLELAKQGRTVVDCEPVDFRALVADSWRMTSTDEEGLTIHGEATISGDPDRLRHLFENLFRNSVEHGSTSSQRGSRADDSVEHGSTGSRPQADDCVEHAGPRVAVTTGLFGDDGIYVEDDGPGIPAAYREVLFEPGYTTTDGGTGFGLAIVAEIVDAHGWTIRVTDSDSGGARFEITGLTVPDRSNSC